MNRRIPLLVAAAVLAVVGLLALLTAGPRQPATAEAAPTDTLPVLVATQPIPFGTSGQQAVDQQLVALKDLPAVAVPPGALVDVVPVRDLVTNTDIQPGEVLLQAKFLSRSDAGSVRIPDDRVAISVAVDTDAQLVAGFVRPGNNVAVFNTYAVEETQYKPLPPGAKELPAGTSLPKVDMATRLLLSSAQVLAVGRTTVQGLATAPPAGAQDQAEEQSFVVTLAVSIEEAQKLAHVSQTSKVTLALLTDRSRTGTTTADDNRTLFG